MAHFAIEAENLVKVYWRGSLFGSRTEAVRAVDGLSFAVERGHIFGLLGPNGAGKTTTLKMLTTLARPTGGRAAVAGYNVLEQPLEVRRRVSAVLQETAVELFLSVRDNLLTFARFHQVEAATARRRAGEVMERLHLTPEAGRKVQDLSGGYKRRVQVAKIFMVDTPVVFLDEFSTGMDPALKRAVMGSLREEAARGRTIILTTQVLSEAEELCDDILIIHKGREVARGDLQKLKLLSQGVYEVLMAFVRLPEGIERELAALAPLRLEISQNTVELAVRGDEAEILEFVAGLTRRNRVLHVEINGASLEDIFVELTKESGAAGC